LRGRREGEKADSCKCDQERHGSHG
jgi:hypothetical protein